jgi:hypothetical protein
MSTNISVEDGTICQADGTGHFGLGDRQGRRRNGSVQQLDKDIFVQIYHTLLCLRSR